MNMTEKMMASAFTEIGGGGESNAERAVMGAFQY